jgi:cellulose synthase/poly-beta-1,6-N-acetylglucosamine synthase-like glycosyltransferase
MPLINPKTVAVPRPTQETPSPFIEETRSILGRFYASGEFNYVLRQKIDLSIVIPAYNEQARLPGTVLETIRWCTTQNVTFELIIADDGSRDETLALGRLFEESDTRIRILACPHLGKGAAVRIGMLEAKGRFVMFMDADGATPLNEFHKLLAAMRRVTTWQSV